MGGRLAILQEHGAKGGQDRLAAIALADRVHEDFQAVVAPAEEDVLFGLEVTEERAWRDIRLLSDLGHRHAFETFLAIEPHSRINQCLARPPLLAFTKTKLGHLLSCTRASMQ